MSVAIVKDTNFPDLKLFSKGKVRDIYDLGENLLIVTTDRISAFDVILSEGIPYKGIVLNQISLFWFKIMEDLIPNHMITCNVDDFPEQCNQYANILDGRSMLVKKARPLPIECVVRGYISGSLWSEFKQKLDEGKLSDQNSVEVCGVNLPTTLKESDKLDNPIFTPATKAEQGDHDVNISFKDAKDLVGNDVSEKVKDISTGIYKRAAVLGREKGIIIADTKFEFGIYNDELILIDEVLSPDSSRFWPLQNYKPGCSQPSFDKQIVRNYLLTQEWDKCPPPPELSNDIIAQTSEKYIQAFETLTGKGRRELGVNS